MRAAVYSYFHETRKSSLAARSARQPDAAPALSHLGAGGRRGLPVGRIQDKLEIAASTLSHHLKRLVDTGLVTQERQATTLICRANYPGMDALIGYLADECCADGACPPASVRSAGKTGVIFLDV